MGRLDLFLVRHGLTDWNEDGRLMGRSEVPINERGRAQAEAVGRALRGLAIERVIASPQRRAQETAEVIARALGLAITTEPLLAEVWLGEKWLGKRFDEIAGDPDLERYFRDPTYTSEAIEPAGAVQERMVRALADLRSQGGAAVIVSHGDPIRLLLAQLLGLPLDHYRRLYVGNGSVSVVRIGRKRCQVLAMNWKEGDLKGAVPPQQ
jgi:broad specificity phosphatase PhoE